MEPQAAQIVLSDAELAALAAVFGVSVGVFVLLFTLVMIWSLAWKGVALWHAARGSQKGWFIALLLIHTLGILEIIYYFFFRKDKR